MRIATLSLLSALLLSTPGFSHAAESCMGQNCLPSQPDSTECRGDQCAQPAPAADAPRIECVGQDCSAPAAPPVTDCEGQNCAPAALPPTEACEGQDCELGPAGDGSQQPQ